MRQVRADAPCTSATRTRDVPLARRRVAQGSPLLLRRGPSVRDEMWLARANEPLLTGDLQHLRYAVGRGRPFGGDACTKDTAERLGLESCLPPNGRPRKQKP